MNEKECRDALDYLYAPLANTMVLEMSYNLLINLIDEHFKLKENTLDFKHFNLYSDSVLKNMNKDKLIEYIHMLYHNWASCDEICQNLMNNAGKLKMDNLEDIKAYLDTCIRYWRSKRDKENCEYAIYYIDCFQSVRSSIFGKCLPVEEKKQIPICKELKNPQPYKFEELKAGMWVWEDRLKACFLIKAIRPKTNWNIVIYANYLTDTFEELEFKENRFFPITKALEAK